MLKFVTADMLDFSSDIPDIIIHQTNCEGRMGGGIAKTIKKKFPKVYVEYLEFLAAKRFAGKTDLLGEVSCTDVMIGDKTVKFVNVYAQYGCSEGDAKLSDSRFTIDGRFTSYDALHDGLTKVMHSIVIPMAEKKGRPIKIWMPAKIGCGKGGGNLAIVTAIITSVFKANLYENMVSLNLFELPLPSGEESMVASELNNK